MSVLKFPAAFVKIVLRYIFEVKVNIDILTRPVTNQPNSSYI